MTQGNGEKSCVVYFLDDSFLVHPLSKTVDGIWIFQGPAERLERKCGDEELGRAVIDALARSKLEIPQPFDWSVFNEESTRALEEWAIPSFHWLQRKASQCCVEGRSGKLAIQPTRNGGVSGEKRGFKPIVEARMVLTPEITEYQLGAAIRQADYACE